MDISRRQFIKRVLIAGGVGLVPAYPMLIERNAIETNVYRIPVPNLPEAFEGFRIVHLTDLHHGFLAPLFIARHVVKRANSLNPDIIVTTGDNVQKRRFTDEIDRVWPVLAGLNAPLGVYSVLGNHDHWADTGRSDYWLKKTGQDLRHKVTCFERGNQKLWLAGAGDLYTDHRNLDHLLFQIPASDCRIVLAHNPDTADTRFKGWFDLMIAGHTHGGQVNFPFVGPLKLNVRNKTYTRGLKNSRRGMAVFISKGIGCSSSPIRFNCYPEIALLELVSECRS